MTLSFRIPKKSPDLSRADAVRIAREMALEKGHSEGSLQRSTSRMEVVSENDGWEYVIQFPDIK